jgi:hypothetical protein
VIGDTTYGKGRINRWLREDYDLRRPFLHGRSAGLFHFPLAPRKTVRRYNISVDMCVFTQFHCYHLRLAVARLGFPHPFYDQGQAATGREGGGSGGAAVVPRIDVRVGLPPDLLAFLAKIPPPAYQEESVGEPS